MKHMKSGNVFWHSFQCYHIKFAYFPGFCQCKSVNLYNNLTIGWTITRKLLFVSETNKQTENMN